MYAGNVLCHILPLVVCSLSFPLTAPPCVDNENYCNKNDHSKDGAD